MWHHCQHRTSWQGEFEAISSILLLDKHTEYTVWLSSRYFIISECKTTLRVRKSPPVTTLALVTIVLVWTEYLLFFFGLFPLSYICKYPSLLHIHLKVYRGGMTWWGLLCVRHVFWIFSFCHGNQPSSASIVFLSSASLDIKPIGPWP